MLISEKDWVLFANLDVKGPLTKHFKIFKFMNNYQKWRYLKKILVLPSLNQTKTRGVSLFSRR